MSRLSHIIRERKSLDLARLQSLKNKCLGLLLVKYGSVADHLESQSQRFDKEVSMMRSVVPMEWTLQLEPQSVLKIVSSCSIVDIFCSLCSVPIMQLKAYRRMLYIDQMYRSKECIS